MKKSFFFLWIVQRGTQYFRDKSRTIYCLFKNNALLRYFLTFQESFLWHNFDQQLRHIHSDVSKIHGSFILINHTVSEELHDAAMAQIVPGTTKSLLFYVIIQINCFIITSYSLKNLQEPRLKIQKSQGQRWGKCFECFWARCKESNLEVFWSNNGVITLTGFFSPWFWQCLKIDFNKFVCFPSKFIKQGIIWELSWRK